MVKYMYYFMTSTCITKHVFYFLVLNYANIFNDNKGLFEGNSIFLSVSLDL